MNFRVLVVEDDIDVRDAVADALRDAGYSVASAENGVAALDYLRSSASLPGIILLDLMMPQMDGLEFRERQRDDPRLAGIPVALLTADGHASEKAERLGAFAGLAKPIRLKGLLQVVEQIARGTSPS